MKYAIKSAKSRLIIGVVLIYIKSIDTSLNTDERFIFLRLLMSYGFCRIDTTDIHAIANRVQIHYLKLKPALEVLCEKGAIELSAENQVRINVSIIKKYLENNKKRYERGEDIWTHYPRFDFIVKLFELIFTVKISHKQKNNLKLLEINFKQWMVLLYLVMKSDRNGIIFNAGTHEIYLFTGMDRYAILRAINKLFQFGILRSKLDGSLNNNYLINTSAVYFLNLSHIIWGDLRIYSKFYVLFFPKKYSVFLDTMNLLSRPSSENKAIEFKYEPRKEGFIFRYNYAEREIYRKLDTLVELDEKFNSIFEITQFKCKNNGLAINHDDHNLKRIEFHFQYIATKLSRDILRYLEMSNLSIPIEINVLMCNFFKLISSEDEIIKNYDITKKTQLVDVLNNLRFEIFFIIIQCIFRGEISHIYDRDDITRKSRGLRKNINLAPYARSKIDSPALIYFSPDKIIQKDEVLISSYQNIQSSINIYRRTDDTVELDLDALKEYGLLHESCTTLDIY